MEHVSTEYCHLWWLHGQSLAKPKGERGHSHMTINWCSKVKIEAIQEHLTVKIASCCDSPNFEWTTCKFSSSLACEVSHNNQFDWPGGFILVHQL